MEEELQIDTPTTNEIKALSSIPNTIETERNVQTVQQIEVHTEVQISEDLKETRHENHQVVNAIETRPNTNEIIPTSEKLTEQETKSNIVVEAKLEDLRTEIASFNILEKPTEQEVKTYC